MNTVLRQELIRFNRLLVYIKSSLNETRRAVLGQIAMIPELERIHSAMSIGKLPNDWAKRSYPSLKPLGSYINDLLARLAFLQKWIDEGEPTVFWLSGFYFTQSFLTAVLQNHSRKNHQQIDRLVMRFDVTEYEIEIEEKPEMGVYIHVSMLLSIQVDLCLIFVKLHERATISYEPPIRELFVLLFRPKSECILRKIFFSWFRQKIYIVCTNWASC